MSRQLYVHSAAQSTAATDNFETSAQSGTNPIDSSNVAGELVMFDINGNTVPWTQGSAIADPFFIAQITPSDEPFLKSNLITPEKIKRASLYSYEAGTNQETEVTNWNTSGDVYLKVTRVDEGYKEEMKTYFVDADNQADASAVASAMADAINADNDTFVTASTSTSTLTITGESGYVSFRTQVFDSQGGEAGDVSIVTTPDRGTGTLAHIKEIEEYSLELRQHQSPYLSPDKTTYADAGIGVDIYTGSTVSSSVGYDLIQLTVETNADKMIGPPTMEITLAFPSDGSASVLSENSIDQAAVSTLFGV